MEPEIRLDTFVNHAYNGDVRKGSAIAGPIPTSFLYLVYWTAQQWRVLLSDRGIVLLYNGLHSIDILSLLLDKYFRTATYTFSPCNYTCGTHNAIAIFVNSTTNQFRPDKS